MSIINAIVVPHPPIILPEIGRGEERAIQATIDAYEKAAEFIAASKPETIVVLTPHSVMYSDWFHISPGSSAKGSFSQFGAKNLRIQADYDEEFIYELCSRTESSNFPAGTEGEIEEALDHGTMVPLYFIKKAYKDGHMPPILRIGISGLTLNDHYRLGMIIRETAEKLNRRVSIIASGDLSHHLKNDGPYSFKKEGPQYDKNIMNTLKSADFGELFNFDDSFCRSAGECGHRSFTLMAGCFDGVNVKGEQLSYEGPFGVGYGVCLFTPEEDSSSRRILDEILQKEEQRLKERKSKEDEFVRLARFSVESFVKTGKKAKMPDNLSPELIQRKAGVFVSLHLRGQLRGCIGTIMPTTESIALEILQNGVSACSEDLRFPAVTIDELPFLEYKVDVLGEPEDILSEDELDVKRYGVIVSKGFKRGLLLPDLEGVDTVEEQISIAKSKAGIGKDEKVKLQRFEVIRHV